MDRCRCEDYARAVEKLRFYTVGTIRPDIIENYDKTGFTVTWIPNGVSYVDLRFKKPKAHRVLQSLMSKPLPKECLKIKKMWCPYMTPVKK